MRTLVPGQRAAAQASDISAHTIVEITDPDGNWRDLSQAIQGADWVNGGSIEETADGNSQRFNMTLQRDVRGFQILSNPEFAGGSLNGYGIYGDGGSGITLTAEADVDAPSGWRMKITHPAGGAPAPGIGGFYRGIGDGGNVSGVNVYRRGGKIIWKITALIPVGSLLQHGSNPYGTEGSFTWRTSQAGTGAWADYIAEQRIGRTGSFSTTGFFYLGAGARPLSWYVRRITATDVESSLMTSLVPLRTDTAANRNAAGAYAPIVDLNRKWRVSTAITPAGVAPSRSRGNLIVAADAYDNGAWTKRGTCTVTPNAVIGPDGKLSGDTIAGVGVAGNDIFQSVAGLGATGTRYEPSFWFQAITLNDSIIFSNPATTANGEWRINLNKVAPGWNWITRNHPAVTIIAEFSSSAGVCGHFWRSLSGAAISFNLGGSQLETGVTSTALIVTNLSAITGVNDWEEIGNGFYDSLVVNDSPAVIQISGRDAGAVLLDGYIRTKRSYGSAGGVSLESALQSMIDDNAADNNYLPSTSGGLTLYVPVATGLVVNTWEQQPGNLMQALNAAAGKLGYIVRFRYDAADVLRLTLWKPNRTATIEDFTIGPTEYLNIPFNKLGPIDQVKNVAEVRFFDTASGTIHTVKSPNPETSASITKYGKRYIGFDVSSSGPINSDAKGQIFVDAVRSDLETPALEQQIESFGLWWVQLGDYVKTLANGTHYDTDQLGGVIAFTHTFGAGTWRTIINLKGKPAGRYGTWLSQGTTDLTGGATPTPINPPIIAVTRSFVTPPTVSQEAVLVTGAAGTGGSGFQWRYRVIQENTVAPAWGAFSTVPALPVEVTVTRGLKWKRTIETQATDASGVIVQDAYDIASKMDALNDNGVIDNTVNMAGGARPFGRGLDTAADVVITTVRAFIDPATATQVDASGRIVGVYRLGVIEPVNNLVKFGDSLGATTVSSLTSGLITVNANAGLPAAANAGFLYIASGFASPVIGRIFVGDGSGWKLLFSKRVGSVTTDLFTFNDGGQFFATGIITAEQRMQLTNATVEKAYWWVAQATNQGITGSVTNDVIFRLVQSGGRFLFSVDNGASSVVSIGDYGLRSAKYLWIDQAYESGLVGLYDPMKVRMIYAIGDLYRLPVGGSSVSGTGPGGQPFFGVFFGYDATTTYINHTGKNLSHGMGIAANGVVTAYIGAGMWTSGQSYASDFVLV